MASARQELFTWLADRAVPGAGRVIKAVSSLDDGLVSLEKKVGGLDDAVERGLSALEQAIEGLSGSTTTERPVEPSSPASEHADRDQPGDGQRGS
jgi:hypothetical protein